MFRNSYTLLCVFVISVLSFTGYSQTPVTFYPSADAQVSSANSTSTYGGNNSSNVSVVSSSDYFRGLFKFDLSSIPSTAVIVSAKLVLTPTAVGEGGAVNGSFAVQGIIGSWVSESTINFSNKPATTSSNQQNNSTWNTGTSKREFDVIDMIKAHVSGSIPLTGIMVRRNSETTVATPCQYHTKEATGTTNHPVLSVAWYVPVTISTATITKTSSMGSNDGSITPTIVGGSHSGGAGTLNYQ